MNKPFWLNVDSPLGHVTLHKADCSFASHRGKANYKGLEVMKRDGGWFGYSTIEEAEAGAQNEHGKYEFIRCSFCMG